MGRSGDQYMVHFIHLPNGSLQIGGYLHITCVRQELKRATGLGRTSVPILGCPSITSAAQAMECLGRILRSYRRVPLHVRDSHMNTAAALLLCALPPQDMQ